MFDPLGQRGDGHFLLLINFARRFLLQMIGRQFHFDDVRAQLAPRCAPRNRTRPLPFPPALLKDEPRGYDQTTTARPFCLANAAASRNSWYIFTRSAEPG